MSEQEINSNYTRPELPPKSSSRWWYIFPAVILPICVGLLVAGDPLDELLDSYANAAKMLDFIRPVAGLLAFTSVAVIATKRFAKVAKAFGCYFVGFVIWGTIFLRVLMGSDGGQLSMPGGITLDGNLANLSVAALFAAATLVLFITPTVLVLSLFVWMFRHSRTLAAERRATEFEEVADEEVTESRWTEARQQRDQVAVGGTPNARRRDKEDSSEKNLAH